MKRRPIVLISPCTETKGVEFRDTSISLSRNYARALTSAGGLPWIAPCLPDKKIIRVVDGCRGSAVPARQHARPDLPPPESIKPDDINAIVGEDDP